MTFKIISKSRYKQLRNSYDKHNRALKKYFKLTGRNWVDSNAEKKYKIPKGTTNKQTSQIEVYEFKNKKNKGKYFAYMDKGNLKITTWTGDKLGDITFLGNEYSPAGLGTRQNFRMKGIDGRTWSGVYFKSSGDYVNMRVVKNKK